MSQIIIQTKAIKRQKSISFLGTFVTNFYNISDRPYILRDHDEYIETSNLISFINSLQQNQKLELIIDSEKVGNIKNLSVVDNLVLVDAPFLGITQTQTTVAEIQKTSLEIFRDNWQRFDKNIDLGEVLRAVFQVDPRMFQSFNMKSVDEQNKILKLAGERIYKATKEL